MVAVAVVTLLAIIFRETGKQGFPLDFLNSLFLWGIVGGFICARLIHVVDHWSSYADHPGSILGFAGVGLYGAIAGAILGAWVYTRIKKVPFSDLAVVADALAVGAPLAQAIGRLGCTINGCCYGTLAPDLPWAVVYTHPASYAKPLGVPLHPAQIYFLLWNLVVFAIVLHMRGRLKPRGSLFFLYLCLYAAGDFALRFFRYADTSYALGLQQAQIISLIILVVALPALIIRVKRFRRTHIAEEQ
jgi:phosphatidylglycerol:prolipoprotein diacylglycerol transferase